MQNSWPEILSKFNKEYYLGKSMPEIRVFVIDIDPKDMPESQVNTLKSCRDTTCMQNRNQEFSNLKKKELFN